MSMEHRWGPRRPVNIKAMVDYRPAGLLDACITDISIGGLRLEMPGVALTVNACLELVLIRREQGVARLHRIQAVVTHVRPDGAGLMFTEFNPDAYRTLGAFLPAERSVNDGVGRAYRRAGRTIAPRTRGTAARHNRAGRLD